MIEKETLDKFLRDRYLTLSFFFLHTDNIYHHHHQHNYHKTTNNNEYTFLV